MKAIKIQITRFVSDDQPGFVEATFKDAYGQEHIVQEKVPVLTDQPLDAHSFYPQPGVIACEIMKHFEDGRVRISTDQPWGVHTTKGLMEFDVLTEQLAEIG